MATDDWPSSGAETETRDPELWDELGLERSDDVPVPFRPGANAPATEPELESESIASPGEVRGHPLLMAILSHLSVLFGVPVFLVPLVRRHHEHSLHHAKAAAVVFFAFYAALAAAMFVSHALTPVAMALYVPGLIGLIRAVRGEKAGWLGCGTPGELLFPWPRKS